jgi:23S rRNA (guanine745-N1)-methyltransferase
MLLCPVRECHQGLMREEKRLVCPQGHSFDAAASGYVNLLQPQDRRSKDPGDTAAAVAARRRLHDRGVTGPLLEAIAEIICPSPLDDSRGSEGFQSRDSNGAVPNGGDVVLDAGCGDGFYLGTLARRMGFEAHGVDISIPAVKAAAKRYPEYHWIVANADRFVPYADRSFSIVMSITARMNAGEFRRVLRDDGRLLVAIPAAEDLIELRSPAGGEGRDRVDRTAETFANEFTLMERRTATTTAELDADAVRDVLLSIYRPMRSQPVDAMRVTFSLDLLLFKPLFKPK